MLPSSALHAAWLAGASLLAGSINAVAGGGSLLSFPALLQVGVPPIFANATNTVALLPAEITSATAYRRELRRYRTLLLPLLLAALTGSFLGARLLMATKQALFFQMVPWLLLTATIIFAVGPPLHRRLSEKDHSHPSGVGPAGRIFLPIGIFIVCLYVGFFGAGSGLLLMGVLSIAGIEDVHEINALKTAMISVSRSVAAITFVIYGAILWHYAVLMMIAASTGGYAAAYIARKHKPHGMRPLIIGIGTFVTIYFFWKIR
ncbi:MAG: sulfite exporter TauE/SafE family protein [Acidobacteriaceae bacterium]